MFDNKETKTSYLHWKRFLEEEVEFLMKNSKEHSYTHSLHVLFYVMKIAETMNLSEEEKDCLSICAVFHDTRRIDDSDDIGHGKRAGQYYKEYCSKRNINYDIRAYLIMSYHDRDDIVGEEEIKINCDENTILLYHIFKDSDALDRPRKGPYALNPNYLRTEEARKLIDLDINNFHL